jgi:hypothetical protein
MAVALMQSTPPPDSLPKMLAWNTALLGASVEKTISAIWRAYVPVPLTLPHFWDSNLLDVTPSARLGGWALESRDVQAILSVGLLGVAAFVLGRTPSVMLLYLVATSGLLLFMHIKVNHGIRHSGHVFLVLVACIWLSLCQRKIPTTIGRWGVTASVTLLFAMHMLIGALAASTDVVYPFSASKEAAEFIQRRGLADATMLGSRFDAASSVANYLNHPIYYAENKQIGTFVLWKKPRSRVSPADLVRQAQELAQLKHEDVVMIVSYDLGSAGIGVLELASFQKSILDHERYWLYLVPYGK